MNEYKFTINGISCTPLGIDNIDIVEKLEKKAVYYRTSLDGDLIFNKTDYDYLISLDVLDIVTFEIKQRNKNKYESIYVGQFKKLDSEINYKNKTYKVECKTVDNYSELMDVYDVKQNILKTSIPNNTVLFDDIKIERITFTTGKTVEFHKLYESSDDMTIYPSGGSPINQGNTIYGIAGGAIVAGLYSPPVGSPLCGYLQNELGASDIVNYGDLTEISTWSLYYTSFWAVDYPYALPITACGSNVNYKYNVHSEWIRYYKYTQDINGQPQPPEVTGWTDLGLNSLGRKWVKPIVSNWGAYNYSSNSFSLSAGAVVMKFNATFEPIETNYEITTGKKMYDVLHELTLLTNTGFTLQSNFFTSINLSSIYGKMYADILKSGEDTSYITNNRFYECLINSISNVKRFTATEPDIIQELSLKELLDILRDTFALYWDIKDNKLRIEHYSYFENQGYNTETIYPSDTYIFNSKELPSADKFSYNNILSLVFSDQKIGYQRNTQENQVNEKGINFNPDIDYILSGASNEDGITIYTSYGNSNDTKSNSQLSFANLLYKYHRWGLPINRASFPILSSNSFIINTSFDVYSTAKNKNQTAFTDNILYNKIDAEKLIKTDIGDATILEKKYSLGSKYFTFKLGYDY